MSEPRDERAALVAYLCEVGLEGAGLSSRIERQPPDELLTDELRLDGAQTRLLAEDPGARIAAAASELAEWDRNGWRLVSVRDDDYPLALRRVHDRPPALFVAGALRASFARSVAVIGSRRASPDGIVLTERLAAELVAAGYTVLSGLAAGVDTAAHRAALAAGGRTVAVIGTGLGRVYPAENRELQSLLAREQAVVSSFWPEDGPSAENFRRRNGVMSGLSLATVIVEASVRSGTRVQARLALAQGRPVCLTESVACQPWAAELVQHPGVYVVTCAADVIAIAAGTEGDDRPLGDPA